ncbi:MAG: NAD(P)-dependent oxidoreductase [Candidatus Poribacteria bacterium]|nr:NAD(P)-dependent oxidoreductase [Candidatus Poribacteria bacterium]
MTPEIFRVGLTPGFLGADGKVRFKDVGLELLEREPHIEYTFIKRDLPIVPPDEIRGLDAFIALGGTYPRETFEGADRLILLARHGVGYDNVDLQAATEANVMVAITPSGVRRPVAEGIIGLMFALSKSIFGHDRAVRAGTWRHELEVGVDLRDRTLGSIGLGNISSELFRLLQPFGMRFLTYDPYLSPELAKSLNVEIVELPTLLQESDYVCVCCPLTDETTGLIGADEFALMKLTAFFINTARGPIVDQRALTQVLRDGRIRGAGIDVFEQEPIAPDDPLLELDNVILSPHAIALTEECYRDIGRLNCQKAIQVSRGEIPDNVVNQEVLERKAFQEKLAKYRDG